MTASRRIGGTDSDRGSVLLLVVGLVVVGLLAAAVVVDASAAFLQRRQLAARADAAALAGAQGIDLAEYYAHGASAATRLDPDAVVRRVRRQLDSARSGRDPGFVLDRVWSDGREVRVRLSMPLRLPFLARLAPERVVVESAARLAHRSVAADAGPYP